MCVCVVCRFVCVCGVQACIHLQRDKVRLSRERERTSLLAASRTFRGIYAPRMYVSLPPSLTINLTSIHTLPDALCCRASTAEESLEEGEVKN